ncbi:MAG: hypothetical protein ABI790_12710 [Betaproteobacteria bacterium]
MQTAQMNSPRFGLPTTPLAGTLDDFRLIHDDYSTSGSFSFRAMRPMLIAAVVIAAGAGITWGVTSYTERHAAKIEAPAVGPDPSVPAAASVPATSNLQVPSAAPTAKDSPVTDPLGPLTKTEESNSMPLAGHGNNHSSESMNPVKARSSVAAKSAPARKVAPAAVVEPPLVPLNEVVAPQPELLTPATPVPAPPVIQEPPVAPAPAAIVPPVEKPAQ